jgi:hypothetical protein
VKKRAAKQPPKAVPVSLPFCLIQNLLWELAKKNLEGTQVMEWKKREY